MKTTSNKFPRKGVCHRSTLRIGDVKYRIDDRHVNEFVQVVKLTPVPPVKR